MRDLKFRAWDGHTMHTPNDCDEFDFYISCEGEIKFIEETSLGGYEPFRHFRHRQSWQVMQYTGLKDKNGVEIYEGDILQSQNWACLCIVEWRDGGFVLPQGESTNVLGYELSCLYEEYPDTTVKVIGNIYQNPELLQS